MKMTTIVDLRGKFGIVVEHEDDCSLDSLLDTAAASLALDEVGDQAKIAKAYKEALIDEISKGSVKVTTEEAVESEKSLWATQRLPEGVQ